ncbi:hypothetical protein KZ483_24100 [Paenibacillus sp. sptzw28]|uniref:hypothetical protein n=1 Tax=Paenibacillus sp. sptzw28 TaxID=715179 RepID=UPI001C6E1CFB|nr:hypothetical protein [Paenibacillus sp. sptzw28]QYR20806.1 hypothetical protein KZ483_24100 [Paenibacillus sp. sptzw28]
MAITNISEKFRTRVLINATDTSAALQSYLAPTPGVKGITLRVVAKMGNAADLALSLKYADDASGTNATAYPVNVPIYKGTARQTDAKAFTITDDSGNVIVDFCVDPATIPDGKFVGISSAISNVANLITVTMIEDVAYRPDKN